MHTFLQTVVFGVGGGALDALLALGIVLVYRTTGVLNFAQAATGTIAAYVMYAFSQGRPLGVAVAAGLLTGAAVGVATHLALGSMESKEHPLRSAVATLAVAILLQQIVILQWGTTVGTFPNPFPTTLLTVGGVALTYSSLAGIAVAVVLALSLGASLRWTRTGTMLRALADNLDGARLCGGNVALLVGGVWAVSGVLAAIAAFFAAQIGLEPSYLDTYFLPALIASVLGGLRGLAGAFAGAVALETGRTLFQAYAPSDVTPYAQTFLILLLIVVLVVAPRRWLTGGAARAV